MNLSIEVLRSRAAALNVDVAAYKGPAHREAILSFAAELSKDPEAFAEAQRRGAYCDNAAVDPGYDHAKRIAMESRHVFPAPGWMEQCWMPSDGRGGRPIPRPMAQIDRYSEELDALNQLLESIAAEERRLLSAVGKGDLHEDDARARLASHDEYRELLDVWRRELRKIIDEAPVGCDGCRIIEQVWLGSRPGASQVERASHDRFGTLFFGRPNVASIAAAASELVAWWTHMSRLQPAQTAAHSEVDGSDAPVVAATSATSVADTRRPAARKRKRRPEFEPRPLTPRQVEVMAVFAECKGNFADTARSLNVDRKTVVDIVEAAFKKIGKKAVRHQTQAMTQDRRGQSDLSEDSDRRL